MALPRFRIRSLALAIAFIAVVLGVIMQTAEIYRLRRDVLRYQAALKAERLQTRKAQIAAEAAHDRAVQAVDQVLTMISEAQKSPKLRAE